MRTRRKSSRKCDHSEAVVTMTAGIQRTVCMNCGAVSIQYDHPVCTAWPNSLARVVEDGPLLVSAVKH